MSDKVQVHKVVVMVVDHDGLGADQVGDVLEHNRYPNHCMGPVVMHTETREVEWSDEHPLNGNGQAAEFARLFGQPEAVFDGQRAAAYAEVQRAEARGALEALADMRVWLRNREDECDRLQALVDGAPLTVAGLVHTAHEAARAKGWHDGADPTSPTQVLAWLALLHSEVSEAVEDVRRGMLAETVVLADIQDLIEGTEALPNPAHLLESLRCAFLAMSAAMHDAEQRSGVASLL